MKLQSIERIVSALNSAKVPFIVVGGVAVVAHGYGRSTQDIDLVVHLEPEHIRHAFAALESLGYHPRVPVTADGFADKCQREKWIAEKGMRVLNFYSDQHPETPVDLFVEEPFDFQAEYDTALVQEIAPGISLRIIRLETLLRLKREAGRAQDIADIAELRLLEEGKGNA